MKSYSVIAYTYEADIHCIACTLKRHKATPFAMNSPLAYGSYGSERDEHGLPYAATDCEGNPVHPVFADGISEFYTERDEDNDEGNPPVCGTCGETIE